MLAPVLRGLPRVSEVSLNFMPVLPYTELGRAVAQAIVIVFPEIDAGEWRLIEHSRQRCEARSKYIAISIGLDDRDSSIASSIKFFDDDVPSTDDLQVVSLAAAVDLDVPSEIRHAGGTAQAVMSELSFLAAVLNKARANGVRPRDIWFFVQGYSEGYTALASGK